MISQNKYKNVYFDLAAPQDASAMVKFHNSYYSTNRKLEQWLWEWQTYEPQKSVISAARISNNIIATFGVIPLLMNIDGENMLAGKSESMLLIPEYRGKGIMTNLYQYVESHCVKRELEFIWGFTEVNEAKNIFKKMDYTYLSALAMAVRPGNILIEITSKLRLKAPLWIRIGSTAKYLAKSIFFRYNQRMPKFEKQLSYEMKEGIKCNEQDLQSLYERLQKKYQHIISIKLDAKYLKWRVREHPFLKYDEYQVYQNGEMRAYAFVTLFEGIASISDLTSEDEHATYILLFTIIRRYQRQAGHFAFLCNPKDSLAQNTLVQLYQLGFKLYPGYMDLHYKDFAKNKDGQAFEIQNWHINGLWTEGYSM